MKCRNRLPLLNLVGAYHTYYCEANCTGYVSQIPSHVQSGFVTILSGQLHLAFLMENWITITKPDMSAMHALTQAYIVTSNNDNIFANYIIRRIGISPPSNCRKQPCVNYLCRKFKELISN